MIVVWLLSRSGYVGDETGSAQMNSGSSPELANAAFHVMYGVPAVCGVIQLLVWAAYTLRGPVTELKERHPPRASGTTSQQDPHSQSPRRGGIGSARSDTLIERRGRDGEHTARPRK